MIMKNTEYTIFLLGIFIAVKLTHEIVCSNYFMCTVEGASQLVLVVKNSPANAGDTKRHGFNPWVENILWRRPQQITPVLLPGESNGHRSLVVCSPWGHTELDATDVTEGSTAHRAGDGIKGD